MVLIGPALPPNGLPKSTSDSVRADAPEEQKEHSQRCTNDTSTCTACILERQIVRGLSKGKDAYADAPREIWSHLGLFSRSFRQGRQEDAHELLRCMAESLERDMLKAEGRWVPGKPVKNAGTLVNCIFQGCLQSQVRCLACKHESNTYDPFMDLSLELPGCNSVRDALARFTRPERLDGDNRYRCERCKQLVAAEKRLTVYDDPNVLVVHLKRFDSLTGLGKISRHIAFEERLALEGFMASSGGGKGAASAPNYVLSGVVVHQGSTAQSGHYYAYVQDVRTNQWRCMNDSSVYAASFERVRQESVYMLFYTRARMKRLRPPPAAAAAPAGPALAKQGSGTAGLMNGMHGPTAPPIARQGSGAANGVHASTGGKDEDRENASGAAAMNGKASNGRPQAANGHSHPGQAMQPPAHAGSGASSITALQNGNGSLAASAQPSVLLAHKPISFSLGMGQSSQPVASNVTRISASPATTIVRASTGATRRVSDPSGQSTTAQKHPSNGLHASAHPSMDPSAAGSGRRSADGGVGISAPKPANGATPAARCISGTWGSTAGPPPAESGATDSPRGPTPSAPETTGPANAIMPGHASAPAGALAQAPPAVISPPGSGHASTATGTQLPSSTPVGRTLSGQPHAAITAPTGSQLPGSAPVSRSLSGQPHAASTPVRWPSGQALSHAAQLKFPGPASPGVVHGGSPPAGVQPQRPHNAPISHQTQPSSEAQDTASAMDSMGGMQAGSGRKRSREELAEEVKGRTSTAAFWDGIKRLKAGAESALRRSGGWADHVRDVIHQRMQAGESYEDIMADKAKLLQAAYKAVQPDVKAQLLADTQQMYAEHGMST